MEGSQIGAHGMSIYDQTEVSREKRKGWFKKTAVEAKNWLEIIIITLICSIVQYTICHLTGITPEIMCYLIIGVKLTIEVKEQKNRKGSSTGDNQSNPTRDIKEKETSYQ